MKYWVSIKQGTSRHIKNPRINVISRKIKTQRSDLYESILPIILAQNMSGPFYFRTIVASFYSVLEFNEVEERGFSTK